MKCSIYDLLHLRISRLDADQVTRPVPYENDIVFITKEELSNWSIISILKLWNGAEYRMMTVLERAADQLQNTTKRGVQT